MSEENKQFKEFLDSIEKKKSELKKLEPEYNSNYRVNVINIFLNKYYLL